MSAMDTVVDLSECPPTSSENLHKARLTPSHKMRNLATTLQRYHFKQTVQTTCEHNEHMLEIQ